MKRLLVALGFLAVTAVPTLAQGQPEAAATAANPLDATPEELRKMPMKPLMSQVIYPASDAIFYVTSREPKTDADWAALLRKTETLLEAARIMLLPTHRRDRDRWMKDAQLMIDASVAAVEATKKKNLEALADLNDAMYESCVTCHKNYRPDYGKKPGGR
jgi:hypothetical protein